MLKKVFLVLSVSCFSFGLFGCADESGDVSLEYSKEGLGKSELEMASERSRREAIKKRSNTLPPPREDGQHGIAYPSWTGGYEEIEKTKKRETD